ncbi:MAG: 1-acyl-sn-glycerol-3-phosphate acyltransferase [Clostridia bacterium]|nr:1-acyl-sn-glycerol-3-phosphate acyltransferase [Clostridia bacterium]
MAVSQERLNTIKKMEELERAGKFDVDPWKNPPFEPLKPGQVDFLRKKISSKIKNKFCNFAVNKFIKKMEKTNQAILKDIKGLEKINNINGGAIVTSNHFNPFDCYPIIKMLQKSKMKKKLHIVLAEHNYTGGTGFYGKVFRNYNTIPLAQNPRVMIECVKAVEHFLSKKDLVLVYPEQALWENYKKPRPLKAGAFRFAVKSNVPVVACFVTMTDSAYVAQNGEPVQEYTLHVLDVIYPKPELSQKENIEYMKNRNELLMKQKYEEVYGKELTYLTKEEN